MFASLGRVAGRDFHEVYTRKLRERDGGKTSQNGHSREMFVFLLTRSCIRGNAIRAECPRLSLARALFPRNAETKVGQLVVEHRRENASPASVNIIVFSFCMIAAPRNSSCFSLCRQPAPYQSVYIFINEVLSNRCYLSVYALQRNFI